MRGMGVRASPERLRVHGVILRRAVADGQIDTFDAIQAVRLANAYDIRLEPDGRAIQHALRSLVAYGFLEQSQTDLYTHVWRPTKLGRRAVAMFMT